ncbi:hypothetical protein [Streptomyces sp. NPDC002671]
MFDTVTRESPVTAAQPRGAAAFVSVGAVYDQALHLVRQLAHGGVGARMVTARADGQVDDEMGPPVRPEATDSDEHQLALLLALKSYQRMGCFPKAYDVLDHRPAARDGSSPARDRPGTGCRA